MKLRTKIAGTVALPLALAIASAASAATVVDTDAHRLNIGGFVAAQAVWTMADAADTNNYSMNLGTSRVNIDYRNKQHDIRFLYEQNVASNSLRHAAIFHDGWVAGQTWSFFANATGAGETVDATGVALTSAPQQRNALLGKVITFGDGMSVGVAAEKRYNTTDTAAPDITVNFKGNFGGVGVFVAGQQYNVNNSKPGSSASLGTCTDYNDLTTCIVNPPKAAVIEDDESFTRFTVGASVPMGAFGLKAAFTQDDKDAYASVAGQLKISDQLRTNLVVEQFMADADDSDYTAVWVNGFYKLQSGWEWGGEVRMVTADDNASAINGLNDKDMRVSLQAKYAF